MKSWFRRPSRASVKPTWRERQAAERTAKAEAKLLETQERIHSLADEMRSDLKHP